MFTKLSFFISLLSILSAFAEQVPLCSCGQASNCANEGSSQVGNCKKECANQLADYAPKGSDTQPLTGCFWMTKGDLEGERLTQCMAEKIDNFCTNSSSSNAGNVLMVANPDYDQWMENYSNGTQSTKGSAFIQKARSAFVLFRNFQKCMNNCAKRHSTKCFKQSGCAISMHSDRQKSMSIYNECTLQNVHKDARGACRCLVQKHKVHQLVGMCPLMSNTYLMRMV